MIRIRLMHKATVGISSLSIVPFFLVPFAAAACACRRLLLCAAVVGLLGGLFVFRFAAEYIA